MSQAQNEEIKRLTVTSLQQNEEVKRISAWAAILFAPTLIGTIYGMNFHDMPALNSELRLLVLRGPHDRRQHRPVGHLSQARLA